MTLIDTLINVHYGINTGTHTGTHTGMRTGTNDITDTINATDLMSMRVELTTGSVIVKRGLVTGFFSGNWLVWYWSATLNRGSLTSVDINTCVGL